MRSFIRKARTYIRKRVQFIACRVLFVYLLGLYIWTAFVTSEALYDDTGPTLSEAVQKYGLVLTIFLYSLGISAYINVPILFCNILGMLIFNPFKEVKRKHTLPTEMPFICFRVVTRGLFPKLVADVTEKNLETCRNVGIKNFKFEIVTDTALGVQQSHYVREVVVPRDYRAPNGTMFKARALHYCLSPNISILSPDDWIVHLDEETLLSESVLHGITQFILDPESNIGQGVITYGETGIENWLTTLLDGIRVALDYGLFRFSMQIFHRPVFGFKGSFIVVKSEIEEEIGFDFGPKECIAEDLRFALAAWNAGYRFDFVEGVMKEKSTFTLVDFVKQRKRWFIGHFHVVWGNSLPFYCKIVVTLMHLANMFLWTNVLNTVLSFVLSVPLQKWQVCIFVLLTFNIFFSLAFGNFMSLCSRRYSFFARVVICFLSQALVPVLAIAESYSSLKGLKDRNTLTFDIVQKEKKKQLSTRNGNDFCTV